MKRKSVILFFIVLSQFFCTSLWFAGNAVASDLQQAFGLDDDAIGNITSSVQFGFISGTLLFAFAKISDRFRPSLVFMICAMAGALSNLAFTMLGDVSLLVPFRFATGFFLAGIYPVGMKIASDYHQKGLGLALGFLVGALVLGTASPHLLKDLFSTSSWQYVFYSTSGLAVVGGLIIGLFVGDGPYRKPSQVIDPGAFVKVFQHRKFRGAAVGYFGHMWELYAFWAFLPIYLIFYESAQNTGVGLSFLSFFTIAMGMPGCILGGYLSSRKGSSKVAAVSLAISLGCCILSPFMLQVPPVFFIIFLSIWGMSVVADSPQFSTLVAQSAPSESIGTALTIVNSLGFAITIVSIQFLQEVSGSPYLYYVLIPGPTIGLFVFYREFLGNQKSL